MKRASSMRIFVLLAFVFSLSPTLAFAAAVNPVVQIGNSSDTSLNWSGYAATHGTFTSISGSWTVPSVPVSVSAEADATWVGVGGISSNDLIQVGTQTITQNDKISYEAWYELLPAMSVPIPITIHAGDSITASLIENPPSEWQVTIRDNTSGQSFSTAIQYSSSLSSAEWIEEMPSDQNGYISLDNFGAVSFTNTSAIENGVSVTPIQANVFPLTMITNSRQALATPSYIGTDGASFTVSRSSVVANVASHAVPLDGRGGFRRGGGNTVHNTHIRTFSVRHIRLY